MKAKALLMILPPLSPRSPNGKIWCCQCSGFLLFLVAGLTALTYLVPQGWPGTNGTSFPRTAVGRVSCMSVWAGRVRRNSNILGSGGARWCHMAFDIFGSYALLYHTMGVFWTRGEYLLWPLLSTQTSQETTNHEVHHWLGTLIYRNLMPETHGHVSPISTVIGVTKGRQTEWQVVIWLNESQNEQ